MALTINEAIATFGEAALQDKNGKQLTAAALKGRIAKLEKERVAEVIAKQAAATAAAAVDEAKANKAKVQPTPMWDDSAEAKAAIEVTQQPIPAAPVEAIKASLPGAPLDQFKVQVGRLDPVSTDPPMPIRATAPRILPDLTQQKPLAPAKASDFVIEDGHKLPERLRGGDKGTRRYPFADLAVGQSFFVAPTASNPKPWNSMSPMASRAGRELYPINFTARRATHNGQDGCRVWRVEDLTSPKPTRKGVKTAA